jgi:hypothetical protein
MTPSTKPTPPTGLFRRGRVGGLCGAGAIGDKQLRLARLRLIQMALLDMAEAADVSRSRDDRHGQGRDWPGRGRMPSPCLWHRGGVVQ